MVLQRHFLLILSAFFLILSPCDGQEFFRIDNAQTVRTTKSVTTSHVILDGETIGTVVFEGPESAETNTPVTIISLLESNLPAYGPPLIEFETLAGVDAASAFKVLTPDLVWSSNKPGTYRILATAVNRETFRIKKQSAIITVGSSPEPNPPGPNDEVANDYHVGKLAYRIAPDDKSNLALFAKTYRDAQEFLYGRPHYKFVQSVQGNDTEMNVLVWIRNRLTSRTCRTQAECERWNQWMVQINAAIVAEQKARSQFVVTDWHATFGEIASALEARSK